MIWPSQSVFAIDGLHSWILQVHARIVVVGALLVTVGHMLLLGPVELRRWDRRGARWGPTDWVVVAVAGRRIAIVARQHGRRWGRRKAAACPQHGHRSGIVDAGQDVRDGVRGRPTGVAAQGRLSGWRRLAVIDSLQRVMVPAVAVRVRGINGVVQRVRIDHGRLSRRSRRQLVHVVMVDVVVWRVAQFVPQDTRDRTDAGHVRLVADALAEQSIADLPGENSRVLLLQLANIVDDLGRGHAWLRSPNGPRQDRPRLVIARQDFRHAAMADPQLPRNITRPDPQACQFDDLHPRLIRQGPSIDK